MLTFAYMVGEWVWQDAYIIKKITEKIVSSIFEGRMVLSKDPFSLISPVK